jgi:hypothetical protein
VRLFEPLGVEAELLGHLDQLLRRFRVLDGLRQLSGSVGLISVVIGLGHGSTFLDMYGSRQKGSMPDCRAWRLAGSTTGRNGEVTLS